VLCAIPWSRLGLRPAAGLRIGFEVSSVDLDKRDGLYSLGTWSGLHLGNHHNASEWGVLELTGRRSAWPYAVLLAAALAGAIGVFVARRRSDGQAAVPPATVVSRRPGALVSAMMELARDEYANENLNLQFVAAHLHKNPKYLSTLFKKETGVSFTAYVNGVRLEQADMLLRTTPHSISHISLEVGYGSHKYFSAVYRKRYGVSPSEVRRQG